MSVQLSLLSKRAVKVRPTSVEARRSISKERISQVKAAILDVLKSGPLPDEFICEYITSYRPHMRMWSHSGIRTRRSELVRAGKVRDTGRTVLNANGRKCVLWERVL